jgi:hypothetical protein
MTTISLIPNFPTGSTFLQRICFGVATQSRIESEVIDNRYVGETVEAWENKIPNPIPEAYSNTLSEIDENHFSSIQTLDVLNGTIIGRVKILGVFTTYFSDFTDDLPAVKAVEHIKDMLKLSQGDVLRAAKIGRSTFNVWKRGDARVIRLGSQGDLWVWYEAVASLHSMLGDQLPQWIANARRRELFLAGNSEKLLSEAMAMTSDFIQDRENLYRDNSVGTEIETPLGSTSSRTDDHSNRPKRVTNIKVIR